MWQSLNWNGKLFVRRKKVTRGSKTSTQLRAVVRLRFDASLHGNTLALFIHLLAFAFTFIP